MPVIESKIMINTKAFKKNAEEHIELIDEFRLLEKKVSDNSSRAKPKFDKRNQLLPRERVKRLLDPGSYYLPISTLAGYKIGDDDGDKNIMGGNSISGIGIVEGIRCMITASDSGIKGGSMTQMGVEKSLRCAEIVKENKLPMINLVESAGANLLKQSEVFIRGGRSFANLAKMSAIGIPTISIVHGSSTAGGAYLPGLSDQVIVVKNKSKIFLAGPPLLKAALGEIATDEELGGADMHYTVSGLAEHMAKDDDDAIKICRDVIKNLGWNDNFVSSQKYDYKEPIYSPEELIGVVPTDYKKSYDVREVIARIVDGSEYLDFKPEFGKQTVTGTAAIHGYKVGIVGNNGPIFADGAVKAAQFIQLCCKSNIPLIFLQNTTGYMVGTREESRGIIKHGSKMIQAVTNCTVPKITLRIGASFGAGEYGMAGRSFDPRFMFSWPNNKLSVMGGEQAGKTMSQVAVESAKRRGEEPNMEMIKAIEQKIIDTYSEEGEALFATARLWDDGIIDPRDTRKVLAECLNIVSDSNKRELRPSTFGVARM
ncbi:acyl-CoA carboxylase subunit beta [Pelagibacterales bacterium]|jgi:geranyl-CoA carboxylase beta subunit|nr:acyl-CoA carboxylase subunit beta [Pelagibacterales bacterium]